MTHDEQRAAIKRIGVLLKKPLRGAAKREVDALADRLTDAWNADWPLFRRCIFTEIDIPPNSTKKPRRAMR